MSVTQLPVYVQPYVSSMQCACAILSLVTCPVLHYISTLYLQRHDFRGKKVIEHKLFIFIFSTTFESNNISHF
jgi:ABC-type sulfate transport system permease component